MGLASAFPGLAGATVTARQRGQRDSLELWYEAPAGPWVEALPVGNGRLGGMVFGRVAQERIQLNEDTLSAGGPYEPNNPAALEALPKVRALIDQERFKEAADLVSSALMGKPLTMMPYGAAGDLLLDFIGLAKPDTYRRRLDLDTAVATTRFSIGKARYQRDVFASAPGNVVVVRLTAAGGGRIDADLRYRHPADVQYGAVTYNGAPAGAAGQAQGAPWDLAESDNAARRPSGLTVAPDGPRALLVEGRNIGAMGIPAALRYAVRVAASGDGDIAATGDTIRIRNATQVTLLVAAATSYVNYADVGGDPRKAVREHTEAASRVGYERLKADHVKAHQALFHRFSLRLGSDIQDPRPTSQRITVAETQPEPTLAALYVQYARYLLLSSSRPGSQPANLQGIWNEGNNPPWGSKYTININTEMNYWPAQAANLAECTEPLLRMVEDLAVTGALTARKCYGARGWVAHHNTDLWRATAPNDGPLWGMWPTGGAWLCQTLWDHYEYHPDQAYLRRIYPLLKGAALFFIDTLVEDPKGRGLVTSPSISPENSHHPDVAVCAGPAMDRQILRDLFGWTLQAHTLLKETDTAFVTALEQARKRLPPDRIGAQGQLQEWLEDWDAGAPEQQHRHVSHLYGVYPSGQINVRDTPELIRAAKVTLNTRGDRSTGWATAWRLALWARMGEGERAHAILLGLLGPERTYPNMFDSHPPFQIDGNFGGAAGILEMLVQSWGGEIHILPALPRAWPEGAVHGLRARGAVELDMEWSAGRMQVLRLRGKPHAKVAVRYGDKSAVVVLDAQGRGRVDGGLRLRA